MGKGLLIFPGNLETPYNYPGNPYPFRQESSFLYFFGIDMPGLTGIIDNVGNKEYIIGEESSPESILWHGKQPSIKELAEQTGISQVLSVKEFLKIKEKLFGKKPIHWLPVHRSETLLQLAWMLGKKPEAVQKDVSKELIKATVKLRSIKSAEEIKCIQKAVDTYAYCLKLATNYIKEGMSEQVVAGQLEGFVKSHRAVLPFSSICTIRGEILHNTQYKNPLKNGKLLLIDSGAESTINHYCSDITRVFPISGKFSLLQKEIYEIVLNANKESVKMIRPGIAYKDIHLKACTVIAQGLKDLEFIKGNVADAVREGAHTLFFPHGLGHMMGLDVHDMEGLGEDFVGYDEKIKRTEKQGLSPLRLARELKTGFVLTVEPGIYFIPELIKKQKAEKKFNGFINYAKLEKYMDFGGIRLEDNVVVTDKSCDVLSKKIPKEIMDIEKK